MSVIDTESVTGELDIYKVTWWTDEPADNPFDDYDRVTSVVLRPRDHRYLDHSYGPMAEEVSRIITEGRHSEASVLRWLALRGCRGIHTLYHTGADGRITAEPPFRPDTAMYGGSLHGVAFIAPDRLSEVTDPDHAVRCEVQELSYWFQGDVYGYSIARRSGEVISTRGGYFGWSDTKDSILRDDVLDEIRDRENRLIEQVQLVAAGFIGII
jgi:hypothetical protein